MRPHINPDRSVGGGDGLHEAAIVGEAQPQPAEFLRNGENAVLIPPNEDALASALSQLIMNPRKREELEENAWISVEPFSWDRHADVTLSLLREALQESLQKSR